VVCIIKNTATLAGSLFTLHCSQIHIDLPTLSDEDKDVSYYSLFFLRNM
jgi:pyruvate kinase